MSNQPQITQFDAARAAGMTAVQAGRWVAYVEKKTAEGEEPITLVEAVAQIQRAGDEATFQKIMRRMFASAVALVEGEVTA